MTTEIKNNEVDVTWELIKMIDMKQFSNIEAFLDDMENPIFEYETVCNELIFCAAKSDDPKIIQLIIYLITDEIYSDCLYKLFLNDHIDLHEIKNIARLDVLSVGLFDNTEDKHRIEQRELDYLEYILQKSREEKDKSNGVIYTLEKKIEKLIKMSKRHKQRFITNFIRSMKHKKVMSEEIKLLQKEVNNMEQDNKVLEFDIELLQKETNHLLVCNKGLECEIGSLEADRNCLEDDITMLNKKLNRMNNANKKLKKKFKNSREDVSLLETQYGSLVTYIDKLEKRNCEHVKQNGIIEEHAKELQEKVDILEARERKQLGELINLKIELAKQKELLIENEGAKEWITLETEKVVPS
ncbi:MAG: hypothetical protein Edafosvirus11_4 [Edafosvirus sp.]|uniref:Uncharacterized protein n=1 Tax=Edafosvirus sp. TaxID=2487765 RepID=A0A3G4ZY89_9VIRU|nr:MAG: hypothetical protein Edafosvirus11_4 [Edafosvirus sp.]